MVFLCGYTNTIDLLGAPGAGKGTQTEGLSKTFGIPHVASGDLFREALAERTELGLLAKSYIEKGELVPDDITIAMVQKRVAASDRTRGAILDGFSRTIEQAKKRASVISAVANSTSAPMTRRRSSGRGLMSISLKRHP